MNKQWILLGAFLGMTSCESSKGLRWGNAAITVLEERGNLSKADARILRLGGRLLLPPGSGELRSNLSK